MNKCLKYLICCLIFISCESQRNNVEITLGKTDYPVIIQLDKQYNKIIRIKFPVKLTVSNRSSTAKSFLKIEYDYFLNKKRNVGVNLFVEKESGLEKISNNHKKNILPNSSEEYLLYTRHFTDTNNIIQEKFKSLITEMVLLKKDTMSIGPVSLFDKKFPHVTYNFMRKDSIHVSIVSNQNKVISLGSYFNHTKE